MDAAKPDALPAIRRVGVVGAGTMGSGIAQVCAVGGADVVVVEVNDDVVARAAEKIESTLRRAATKGTISEGECEQALGRLQFSTDLEAMADRDLVIEAVIESEDEKVSVFEALDKITPAHCILASNTSSIPIIRLGHATSRAAQVIGMHFFNPAPVQPLVEVVKSLTTANATVESVDEFCVGVLKKHVIHCNDRAGFVVNLLLVPYLLHAIRMFDQGFATARDIDDGMRYGCAHPMGPLELCDLIGLDTIKAVADVLHEEWSEPSYAAPPLLKRMVSAGLLGRKSGRGFYEYS